MATRPYAFGHFLLRLGIASALVYPPFAALSDPVAWMGYFPAFVNAIPIDSIILLHAFGVIEVLLALWLLWGRALRFPAIVTALLLVIIVLVNLNDFDILFRDVSLALAALSLALLPEPASLRS